MRAGAVYDFTVQNAWLMNNMLNSFRLFSLGAMLGFAPLLPALETPAPRPAVIAKSLVREDDFVVPAKAEAVFPLLCPVREYDWLPGWDCELLYSKSGVAEAECVFRTVRAGSGTMLWVVSRYEAPRYIEFTCFNAGTEHVMRLSIELSPSAGGGTRLHWRRRWLSTGPMGDKVVDGFNDKAHREIMQGLEKVMTHFLKTGRMYKEGN